jgi:SAM-dependent methyltransferase
VINATASAGFERGAVDYERARPSYPQAMLDVLPLGGRVVDLAAGTGKLTRLLRGDVVAVEPVAAMRAIAATFAPAIGGVAEALPFRDGSVDVVTVAQAFHWFRTGPALREIARVLRPGGTLAMMWNDVDDSLPWAAEVHRVIRAQDNAAYERDIDWPAIVAQYELFTPVERVDLPNPFPADRAAVVARAMSTSFVSAASADVRDEVARDVAAVVAGMDEPFDFPYVTMLFTCRRR